MRAQLQNARNDARLLPAAKWMRHNNNNNNNNQYTGSTRTAGSRGRGGGVVLQGLRGAVGQQQCRKHEWQQAELRQKRKVQCKEHAKRDERKREREGEGARA